MKQPDFSNNVKSAMGKQLERGNGAPHVMIVNEFAILLSMALEEHGMQAGAFGRVVKIWMPEMHDYHDVKVYDHKALVCFRRLIDLHDPDSINRIVNSVRYCSIYWDDKRHKACVTCPK